MMKLENLYPNLIDIKMKELRRLSAIIILRINMFQGHPIVLYFIRHCIHLSQFFVWKTKKVL